MALQLVVRIIEAPFDMAATSFDQVWQHGQIEWGVLDTVVQSINSKMTGHWPQLKEFVARQAGLSKIVVMVPGADVLLTTISMPGRRTRHLKQAIPFLLEEQLASDIEDNFFAVGAKNVSANQYPVAVVSHAKMALWVELLSASGLSPDLLTPDVLLVPKADHGWSLLVNGDLAWLRTGFFNGVCFDRQALPYVLESAVQGIQSEQEDDIRIDWIEGGSSASIEGNQVEGSNPREDAIPTEGSVYAEGSRLERQRLDTELDQLSDGRVRISEARVESGLLESFCKVLLEPSVDKRSLNLLQDPYQIKRPGLNFDLGFSLRPLVSLFVVWLVLVLGIDLHRTHSLEQQSAQLKQQSVRLFQSYFPNEKGSVRLRQRMENYLKSAGKGSSSDASFLDLLGDAGAVLQTVNQTLSQAKNQTGTVHKIAIQRLSYDGKQSDLRIDIQAPDFASLEKYKSALEAKNLQVDISSAVAKGTVVEGRIKVFR